MILTELDYGEVRSERKDLDLIIEAAGERFQVPVRFVEDELNLGPMDDFTLSYGATLNLTKLGPAAFRTLGPTNITRGFRLANVGGVYIQTRGDLHLCLELEAVPSVDPARGGELVSWYRLFRSLEGEDALIPLTKRPDSALVDAIDEALAALEQVTPHDEGEAGGHNGPPEPEALSAEDYESVRETLVMLRGRAVRDDLTAAQLPAAIATLDDCVRKITGWARKRLAMVEEGFYRGVGTAVGTGLVGLAAWVATGGKIGTVSALLSAYAGHLLGK